MKKVLISSLKVCIIAIGIVILVMSIFWLPNMARISVELYPEVAYLKYPILFGIYLTCFPFYIGIFHAFKLIKFINNENVFTEDACKSLRIIAFSTIAVIMLYAIGIVYLRVESSLPPALFFLGMAIIFASFIIAVLSAVFEHLIIKVIDIKNENDLTV